VKLTRAGANGAIETVTVSKLERIPHGPGKPESFLISKVSVEHVAVAKQDLVKVESKGKPAGVLTVDEGLGERIAKWLLSDARTVGVE
jgi:hypothetical protein